MRILLTTILILILSSCNTERQLQKAEVRLAASGRLPEICASRYPLKDSIVYKDSTAFDTIYTEAIDTVRLPGDTVKLPGSVRVITRYKTIEKYTNGTSKLSACEAQVASLHRIIADQQKAIAEAQRTITEKEQFANTWKTKAGQRLWLWIIIGLLIGWIVRKPVARLTGL